MWIFLPITANSAGIIQSFWLKYMHYMQKIEKNIHVPQTLNNVWNVKIYKNLPYMH